MKNTTAKHLRAIMETYTIASIYEQVSYPSIVDKTYLKPDCKFADKTNIKPALLCRSKAFSGYLTTLFEQFISECKISTNISLVEKYFGDCEQLPTVYTENIDIAKIDAWIKTNFATITDKSAADEELIAYAEAFHKFIRDLSQTMGQMRCYNPKFVINTTTLHMFISGCQFIDTNSLSPNIMNLLNSCCIDFRETKYGEKGQKKTSKPKKSKKATNEPSEPPADTPADASTDVQMIQPIEQPVVPQTNSTNDPPVEQKSILVRVNTKELLSEDNSDDERQFAENVVTYGNKWLKQSRYDSECSDYSEYSN